MNIDELTIGQVKEIAAMLGGMGRENQKIPSGIDDYLGYDVIIRTYSAGVWFGMLAKKDGNEVVLHDAARRMWKWKCKQGISLSEIALYGINHEESRICAPVPAVWLEAIEIIPVSDEARASIMGAKHAEAR